eukprot:PhM_4_TR15349/c0_g2_i1/m.68515
MPRKLKSSALSFDDVLDNFELTPHRPPTVKVVATTTPTPSKKVSPPPSPVETIPVAGITNNKQPPQRRTSPTTNGQRSVVTLSSPSFDDEDEDDGDDLFGLASEGSQAMFPSMLEVRDTGDRADMEHLVVAAGMLSNVSMAKSAALELREALQERGVKGREVRKRESSLSQTSPCRERRCTE